MRILPSFLIIGAAMAGAVTLPAPTPLWAGYGPTVAVQAQDTIPDAGLEALLRRAREARTRSTEGLESFEGVLREWAQVDLSAQRFRRTRSVFAQERVGRIRWHRSDTHIIQWEGAARALPLGGEGSVQVESSSEDEEDEFDLVSGRVSGRTNPEDLARDLLRSGSPAPLLFDQGTDRLLFGPSDWALHPLADTASLYYRYEAGDTIRLRLPDREAPLELVEVRVEPRELSFRLISGILWIEPETGFLVRAAYRPGRPFDLRTDLDGTPAPRFGVPPIQFEIRTVAVDHALMDLTWWVPWRYRFEGEFRIGSLFRFPIVFEWSVTDLDVNEPPSEALQAGAQGGDGWTLRVWEREGRPALEIRVAPPETLAQGARTMGGDRIALARGTGAFTTAEIAGLEAQIRSLAPSLLRQTPTFRWGVADAFPRFNRVEGFSIGITGQALFPSDRSIEATLRAGHADRSLRGEIAASWGPSDQRRSISVYRRLDPSSEWGAGHGLGNTLSTAFLRNRWTPFHASKGAELRLEQRGLRTHTTARLFGEQQRPVFHHTDLHLWRWGGRPEAPPNLEADPGTWWGGSLFVQAAPASTWAGISTATRGRLEAATGTRRYARGWASGSVRIPLPGPFQLAMEAGGGSLRGEGPAHRHFMPGDVEIFRSIRSGEVVAERFTFRRAEVGAVRVPVGLVAFVDELHIREPGAPTWSPRRHAGGVGISLGDGLFRADAARPIGSGSPSAWHDGWRFFFYLDGLF